MYGTSSQSGQCSDSTCAVSQHVILLIDDARHEQLLFSAQLRRLTIPVTLECVDGGAAAIQYLDACRRTEKPWPWFVFLDIHMPEIDGFAVLRWARAHAVFGNTLVVMHSSSDVTEDIDCAFAEGAHGYLKKDPTGETVRRLILEVAECTSREELRAVLARTRPA